MNKKTKKKRNQSKRNPIMFAAIFNCKGGFMKDKRKSKKNKDNWKKEII